MPVNPALKQRLVQQFQQKQQENSLAAQASIAPAHSHEHPRSSGSKEEEAVVQVVGAPAPPVVAPPAAAAPAEIKRLVAPELDKPTVVVAPSKKSTSAPKPVPNKQQQVKKESTVLQASALGKKRGREDQAPTKPKPSSMQQQKASQQQQKQPLVKRTKTANPFLSVPLSSTEPSAAPEFIKKVETVATTPLEILSSLEGNAAPRPAGHIPAPTFASYSELWTAIRGLCGEQVNRTTARLCYQDNEDDWIALLPGTPFSFFTKSVKKVLVVPLTKKEAALIK